MSVSKTHKPVGGLLRHSMSLGLRTRTKDQIKQRFCFVR